MTAPALPERPYGTILVAVDGPVCTITLNAPDRKNALGPAMVNELLWALDDARDAVEVRTIVLTGAGGTFSAGADLKHLAAGNGAEPALAPKGDFADLLLRFPDLGKPTVAKVRGVAFGGGLGLAASCDFVVASEAAVLGTPEIKRGLFPMMIMAVLARYVPRRALLDMMLLGNKVSAAEGRDLGLVSRVVADDLLDDAVAAIALALAEKSPSAMRHGLHAFHRHAWRPLPEALPELSQALLALLGTEDAQEGLAAFAEKRAPVWRSR